VGAIEAGGTRVTCAVGTSPLAPLERVELPTADAPGTLAACLAFFDGAQRRHGPIAALGIGCFGPLQLSTDAPDYGRLLATPKPGWSAVDVVSPFREALGVPVVLDTDVGAAARGELAFGAGRGKGSLAYVTVGTGIGGAVVPKSLAPAGRHAEMGHLPVRRDPCDSGFAGLCPFHGDCLEGLASGPAIRARWGHDLSDLPPDHPGREIIAGYVAQLAAAIALLHSPDVLVIGGGVMSDGTLIPIIRNRTLALLGRYLPHLADAAKIEAFITAPALGRDSAIAGAGLMALEVATGATA
jgi:fructokinase